jgi:hypothetical protein
MTNAAIAEIPGWEFESKERSNLVSVLFPRHEPEPIFEPTLDAAYLTDYDAETFAQAA